MRLSKFVRHLVEDDQDGMSQSQKSLPFDVYLNGKLIDTVWGLVDPSDMVRGARDMKNSLVNHDSYDPNITVKGRRAKKNESASSVQTKVAKIRDKETPVGQPGKLHYACPCGAKPAVTGDVVKCSCGRKYDPAGWLMNTEGLTEAKRTPWGMSDSEEDVGQGIKFYGTPSHGGYYVPSNLVSKISPAGRAYAKKWSGSENWYEEDQGWKWVVAAFPELFKGKGAQYDQATIKADLKRYEPGGDRYEESHIQEARRIITEAKFTYEGGRSIYKDGKPFIRIDRPINQSTGASPVECDAAAHLIAELLNKANWEAYLKKYEQS